MTLYRSSAIIGSFTLLSRILGFVRDVLIANVIGASWLSDAFFVAFKLPNFFRRLFAEGAFNAAFVPQFAGLIGAGERPAALRFAGHAFGFLLLALLFLNALFLTFMPSLLHLFAPGFTDHPEKYTLTVELARICFPYILFISLVSLLSGILNSLSRFAAVAATPILLNLSLISAILFLPRYVETPAHALSWGVFAAGLLQLGWLSFYALRLNVFPRPRRLELTPPVKRFFRLIAPAALGAGVAQVNLLIDVVLASLFPEGVSYLYYADRLNELPIGVIGVAVGTALLPVLSKQYKQGAHAEATAQLNRAIELVLLFALPATVAFFIIPEQLVATLYQHGAFTPDDTRATFLALIAYAAGLPAFVLVKVFAPGFYANEDTLTPFKIALLCVLSNLVMNLILMQFMAHVGLALATSLASWLNAGLMALILYRRGFFVPDRILRNRLMKFFLASVVMGAVLWLAASGTASWPDVMQLSSLVTAGLISFFGMAMGLRAFSLREIRRLLRRK